MRKPLFAGHLDSGCIISIFPAGQSPFGECLFFCAQSLNGNLFPRSAEKIPLNQ